MKTIEELNVIYALPDGGELPVGILWKSTRGIILELDQAYLDSSYNLSPLTLPKESAPLLPQLSEEGFQPFHGLFGLFADSLPDQFGLAVSEEKLNRLGYATGPLELLSYIGKWGKGAIGYQPTVVKGSEESLSITELFEESLRVGTGKRLRWDHFLDYAMGSVGGTRPKAYVTIDKNHKILSSRGWSLNPQKGDEFLIKFDCTGHYRGRIDNETRMEAALIDIAKDAGIQVPKYQLIYEHGRAHLALKRFDRNPQTGIPLHLHSFWGILQQTSESTQASYENILSAAYTLSGSQSVLDELFKRMVFNILSQNQDDHLKQHAMLYDGRNWKLSPAYDLTHSKRGIGHSTLVQGARFPQLQEIYAFAREMGIHSAKEIVFEIATLLDNIQSYLEYHRYPEEKAAQIRASLSLVDQLIK